MASKELIFTKKTIDKRNIIKERIADLKESKKITTADILGKISSGGYYEDSISKDTINGYNAVSKGALPVEYLIMLHELYDVSYNFLFGVQDNLYDEKSLKTKLTTEAYETVAELSNDEFSAEVLNSLLENYLPALIEKIKTAYISKLIYREILRMTELESKYKKEEQDLFDTSIDTDILLCLKQMVNDILHDDVINLRHDVDRETFKNILTGFKARTEIFSELYDKYNKTSVLDKKYTNIKLRPEHEEQIMQQAHNLKEILNVSDLEKK